MIDFYFACNDFLAYDLAICLNAWCFEPDHSFNATKARRMVAAYHKVRPIDGAGDRGPAAARARQRAALPADPALRLAATTRKAPWSSPRTRSSTCKKLRFHRSVKSAAAYGL